MAFRAVLAHARAYVYGDSSCARWEPALAFLDQCEAVFQTCDPQRWRSARHLRAAILVRKSDYEPAADLYRQLRSDEKETLARAFLTSDLAECYTRMGRPEEALVLVDEAIDVYAARRETLAFTRAMWTRGEALSALGHHDEAIRTLSGVAASFAEAALNDDELGAELSVLRAVRAKDPEADVAARLENAHLLACALDAGQPLRSGARRAAVWVELQSAYRRRSLTADVLAHAASYLRTLGRADEAPFVPPQ